MYWMIHVAPMLSLLALPQTWNTVHFYSYIAVIWFAVAVSFLYFVLFLMFLKGTQQGSVNICGICRSMDVTRARLCIGREPEMAK